MLDHIERDVGGRAANKTPGRHEQRLRIDVGRYRERRRVEGNFPGILISKPSHGLVTKRMVVRSRKQSKTESTLTILVKDCPLDLSI